MRNRVDFVSGPVSRFEPGSLLFSKAEAARALAVVRRLPGYSPTALHALAPLAERLGVGSILYKDESQRFGVGSFKSLGAAYAVVQLAENAFAARGVDPTAVAEALLGRRHAVLDDLTVVSATAGNYGRALAWACGLLSIPCRLYVHRGVSTSRIEAMEALGADVTLTEGNYDDSVRRAARDADENGWAFVSDTVIDGHSEPPRWVATGYSVLVEELAMARANCTHVIIPTGVGGLAAGFVSALYLKGAGMPKVILAEPTEAACFLESARAGALCKARGTMQTLATPLACAEPSPPAWNLLMRTVNGFVAVGDDLIRYATELLAATPPLSPSTVGFCNGAGLAALIGVLERAEWRASVSLNETSRVLILGTEGR